MTDTSDVVYYMGRDVADLTEPELREALRSALFLLADQQKRHAEEVSVWMELARTRRA